MKRSLVMTPVATAVLVWACVLFVVVSAHGQPSRRVAENGRRLLSDEPTVLAFNKVTVEELLPFLIESTGKVVVPRPEVLVQRITIVNDQPIPRQQALDMVFFALLQNDIAVVEFPDRVILRNISEIDRQDVPVIPAGESVLGRTDIGLIFEKVFTLRSGTAENFGELLEDSLPDFAKLTVDEESNQIVVMGNVGLLQRIERLVLSLDQPSAASLATETFHLRYADAEQIAENISELFSSSATTTGSRNDVQFRIRQLQAQRGGRGGNNNNNNDENAASVSENLRVTANSQTNSVTVLAERDVLDQIREVITTSWDVPLPEEAVIPRVYDLVNIDPIKVRDVLTELFGEGTGGNDSQGVGRLAGQFSFEAIPEAARLIVLAKSPDHLSVIDEIISDLDQPQTAGLPQIIELKHASAEELAEQLNALLSREGTLAQIPRSETGLSDGASTASPFSENATQTNNQAEEAAETITFWWQRAQPPTDIAGSSNLVSKIRIVPVWRQNALMVLAPPEYQSSIVEMIERLDQPGRQVLLAAVIAEIAIEDATDLGLRWSSSSFNPTRTDNSLQLGPGPSGNTFTGTQNDLLPGLFDTSVLDVGLDINLLLQALAQKTSVNVLSEPRIFTSDNQEAEFFDGQDIPFVTDSQTTDTGSVIQGFDYRAVGIQLRVRPRITPRREVDLRINLELSSLQPGQTLFGGFIVDRRETTTHLIVADGQTVVISGILRSEDSDIKRKVPILGDIPLIGLLFQSTETVQSRTELLAFITPIVVENDAEVEDLNIEYNDRLGTLREELGSEDDIEHEKIEDNAEQHDTGTEEPAGAPS